MGGACGFVGSGGNSCGRGQISSGFDMERDSQARFEQKAAKEAKKGLSPFIRRAFRSNRSISPSLLPLLSSVHHFTENARKRVYRLPGQPAWTILTRAEGRQPGFPLMRLNRRQFVAASLAFVPAAKSWAAPFVPARDPQVVAF